MRGKEEEEEMGVESQCHHVLFPNQTLPNQHGIRNPKHRHTADMARRYSGGRQVSFLSDCGAL